MTIRCTTAVALAAAFCALPLTASAASTAPDGKAVYTKNCASCHQANGQGLATTFPPLAKNSFVTGDPKKVIATVLHGLNGNITVNGKTYNGTMPAWKGQLSNAEIAAVITYVRTSWGNKASKVSEKDVAAVK
jgi:cbb3-type cytochrome c oxidase subunit III